MRDLFSKVTGIFDDNFKDSFTNWDSRMRIDLAVRSVLHYQPLRLRANGHNIVGQQLPTLLDVTCCVCLHTLLHVVGCCCETGHTFSPVQTDATLLANNSQHCWKLLRPFARSLSLFQVFRW